MMHESAAMCWSSVMKGLLERIENEACMSATGNLNLMTI